MVRKTIGKATDDRLIDVCLEVTGGNPFYLHELLLALGGEPGASGDDLVRLAGELAPDAVARSLRVRVGRLGAEAGAIARAAAILGNGAALREVAALAGQTIDAAANAADWLAAAEVLMPGEPLRFVHPLVRRTMELDIPASKLASRHLDAARLLHARGDDVQRVAAHLLLGRPEAGGWAVGRLRAAAAEASARGAPESAVVYLKRALVEPPSQEQRAEVLAELGVAEAAIGDPHAADRLAQAIGLTPDSRRRAELALERGRALSGQGRHEEAAAAYEKGLGYLGPAAGDAPDLGELHDQLQADL